MMIRITSQIELDPSVAGETVYDDDGFADACDRVMDELTKLDCVDPVVEVDFAKGYAEFSFAYGSSAANPGQAMDEGVSILRAAMHAAGISTPGWENMRLGIQPARKQGNADLIDV